MTGRDAAATAVVGTDTLRSIESVRGTQLGDIYDAVDLHAPTHAPNGGGNGDQGNFNEFEGMGGNDTDHRQRQHAHRLLQRDGIGVTVVITRDRLRAPAP